MLPSHETMEDNLPLVGRFSFSVSVSRFTFCLLADAVLGS